MAIRKNPDWTVWLADVWHWARTPPGIYIVIISLLACGLLYTVAPTRHPSVVYQQPTSIAAPSPALAPTSPPYQQEAPSSLPPPYCDPGRVYDDEIKLCVAFRPGAQNFCDDDYIFVTRYNACISIQTATAATWGLHPNDQFTIAGVRRTEIKVLSGRVLIVPISRDESPKWYEEGANFGFIGRWKVAAGNNFARIKIFYQ